MFVMFYNDIKDTRRCYTCTTESVCLFLCSLCTASDSYEQICMKLGKWHPSPSGWSSRLASATQAHRLALRAPSVNHWQLCTSH